MREIPDWCTFREALLDRGCANLLSHKVEKINDCRECERFSSSIACEYCGKHDLPGNMLYTKIWINGSLIGGYFCNIECASKKEMGAEG
jgi:hypothetical protein